MLDDGMADALPEELAKVWKRFRPAGRVGGTLVVKFDGQTIQPDLTVHCQDVAFEDREKFPYRVRQGTGNIHWTDPGTSSGSQLDVNLIASASGTPVSIKGKLNGLPGISNIGQNPKSKRDATGWFEITGKELTITDELVAALEEKAARVIQALDAKGRFSLRWRFDRTNPTGPPQTETDLTFLDCQVRFDKFPYPLAQIQGQAFERNGSWEFRNLVSRDHSGTREIHAAGTCKKTPEGHFLDLGFTGHHVPLDDTLRQSLKPDMQEAWSALRPEGQVKFTASVRHLFGGPEPDIHITAEPMETSVSLAPKFFPYRFDQLTGQISIHNGQVTAKQLRASHGPTRFSTDATWVRTPRGGFQFDLANLNVDRLTADYDLVHASPLGLQKVIETLKPTGKFSIHNGRLRFTRDTANSTHLRSEWNLRLGCQQNNMQLGVPLQGVTGIMHLTGKNEGNSSFTAGNLDIDSVFLNGFQLTKVRGPIWVDNQEFRLGRGATQRQKQNRILRNDSRDEQIAANFYGGRLTLDANVRSDPGRYTLALQIDQADLKRMSTEYFRSTVDLTGSLSGQGNFSGLGKSIDLLEGGGQIAIRDASMYELPVMARMLKVLRNRVPDKTAFTGVDAQFAVAGKDIRFDKLNLLGDAISLYGQGNASLDRQIDLKFHTIMGRNEFNARLFRNLVGQASANLLLIEVTGSVDNPQVERRALPAVNEFVEQLGEGPLANQKTGSRR